MTSLGKRPEINPSVNAVIDAHNRRRFRGRFKTENQSVELDTLLHQDTKGAGDNDLHSQVGESKTTPSTSATKLRCRAFQKEECSWPNCRFQHLCNICDSASQGAVSCVKRKYEKTGSRQEKTGSQQKKDQKTKPPHPRYRRDRAKD